MSAASVRGPAWPATAGAWGGLLLSATIRAAYFASLGTAYTRGDLSLVYPLARGIAPVLVPVVAIPLLGERPSPVGAVGIATVALGVYVLRLPGLVPGDVVTPFRALAAPHARYAALTGLLTARYSIADKWNMARGIPPIVYAYLTIPVAALLLTPLAARHRGAAAAEGTCWCWRRGRSRR